MPFRIQVMSTANSRIFLPPWYSVFFLSFSPIIWSVPCHPGLRTLRSFRSVRCRLKTCSHPQTKRQHFLDSDLNLQYPSLSRPSLKSRAANRNPYRSRLGKPKTRTNWIYTKCQAKKKRKSRSIHTDDQLKWWNDYKRRRWDKCGIPA